MDVESTLENWGEAGAASQSQRLRTVLTIAEARLKSLVRDAWFHPRFAVLYPELLFAMYGVTMASAPAMRMAARLCEEAGKGDTLQQWLRDYYLEHAAEEEGHGEWILDDLASLGVVRERVLGRLPYASAAALVGSQYYWMKHVHPVAYLGFIAVVEAPADLEFLHEVSRRTGIPLSSMSCHVRHAELDPDHVAEFDAMLDSLQLTAEQRDLITVSAITTVGHLERFFEEILEHFCRIGDPEDEATIFKAGEALGV